MLNIMTYDFHGSWDPMTGECSPLYKSPEDQGGFVDFNVVCMMLKAHLLFHIFNLSQFLGMHSEKPSFAMMQRVQINI